MDIQTQLDEWLANNPDAQKYITALYYVPDGGTIPATATHVLRLNSATSLDRALTVALDVKPEFAVMLDALLAMIATAPPPAIG